MENKRITNPYGANGTTADPRQAIFWKIFSEKMKKGIQNAYQSAVEAGYTPDTAETISTNDWFQEGFRSFKKKGLFEKAEKVLEKILDMNDEQETVIGDILIKKIDPSLLKIKQDTAKFMAERLGKEEYSTRVENTGAGGQPILVSLDVGLAQKYQINQQNNEVNASTIDNSDGHPQIQSGELREEIREEYVISGGDEGTSPSQAIEDSIHSTDTSAGEGYSVEGANQPMQVDVDQNS